MKNKIISSIAVLALTSATFSAAAVQSVSAVPTKWRLQSYGGSQTVLWYTGSSCGDGQLLLDPNDAGTDRQKLLWATILSAKTSQLPVYIEYNVSGTNCYIETFGIDVQ